MEPKKQNCTSQWKGKHPNLHKVPEFMSWWAFCCFVHSQRKLKKKKKRKKRVLEYPPKDMIKLNVDATVSTNQTSIAVIARDS